MGYQKRNGLIDLYKFLASIVIVCFHIRGWLSINGKSLFQSGYLAVELFFIISGIMLAQEADRRKEAFTGKEALLHLRKSFLRLMPDFYIAWLFSFIVKHIVDSQLNVKQIIFDLINSVGEITLLRAVGVRGYFSNAPTWYLSVMIVAGFILYGLIRVNHERYYGLIAPLIFIFLFGFTYNNYGGVIANDSFYFGGLLNGNMCVGLMDMCLGTIVYKVSTLLPNEYSMKKRIVMSVISWICILVVFIYFSCYLQVKYMDWIIFIPLTYSILVAYSRIDVIGTFFDNKAIYFGGKISFDIYLIHWSVARLVRAYGNIQYCKFIYFTLVLVASFFLYFISDGIRKLFLKEFIVNLEEEQTFYFIL